MKNSKNQRGFTLIELSIVLVLIGLIIGGVLKGQELISSTRLKMTVSQWDAVKAAVNSFQDKYVAVPGDYDQAESFISGLASDGSDNGNGNGIVGTAVANNGYGAAIASTEHKLAWKHLYNAGFLSSVDTANDVLPAKVPGGNFYILYGTFGSTNNERTAHWLRLQSGNAVTALTADPVSPNEASEIDRKYDDDDFAKGSIQADNAGSTECETDKTSNADACTVVLELF